MRDTGEEGGGRIPERMEDEYRWRRREEERCQLSAPGWAIMMLMSKINTRFECHRLRYFLANRPHGYTVKNNKSEPVSES